VGLGAAAAQMSAVARTPVVFPEAVSLLGMVQPASNGETQGVDPEAASASNVPALAVSTYAHRGIPWRTAASVAGSS